MTETTPKKGRGPGRPFLPGNKANAKGINGHTKTIEVADDTFLDEFFKEVEALQDGQVVKASRYKLFISQMITAGIKGGTPAKRLVLQHFEAVQARRKVDEALRIKKAAESGTSNFSWDAEKERVLQELKAAAKAAKAQRE